MQKMKRSLALWVGLGIVTALCSEPSVYGRTYSNRSGVGQNSTTLYALKQQVAQMQEEIEGLRSLVQGLNQRLAQLESRQKSTKSDESLRSMRQRIGILEGKIAAMESQRRSPSALQSTKKKQSVKKSMQAKSQAKKSQANSSPKSSSNYLERAPSNKLFSRGVRLLHQKRYSDAKLRFDILKNRNYKPASTQFYLGEIAFAKRAYDEAIGHYQKSAELNENAAYMDRLLLHTGIALEKSGDKTQAKNFFQAIVDGYPGTSSAREAKKHLK